MEPLTQDAASVGRWKREHAALERRIETARSFHGLSAAAAPVKPGVRLRRGERLFLMIEHAGLVEPGRSAVDVAPVLDRGVVTVTDRRVVFAGEKRTREWVFGRLVEHRHYERRPTTLIEVTNRKRVSGIAYDATQAADVRFLFDLALAHHRGTVTAFETNLRRQLMRHDIRRPGVRAGVWLWRGWTRPVPVVSALLSAILVAAALMFGAPDHTSGPAALAARGAGELGVLLDPPEGFAAGATTNAAATDADAGAGSGTARGTGSGTTRPAPPAPEPSCASVVVLGPVTIPDPVCATLGS